MIKPLRLNSTVTSRNAIHKSPPCPRPWEAQMSDPRYSVHPMLLGVRGTIPERKIRGDKMMVNSRWGASPKARPVTYSARAVSRCGPREIPRRAREKNPYLLRAGDAVKKVADGFPQRKLTQVRVEEPQKARPAA